MSEDLPLFSVDRPHERLLAEILQRLFEGASTEGVTLEPYGPPFSDAWGAGQWVKMTTPDGEITYHRLLTEKRDQ